MENLLGNHVSTSIIIIANSLLIAFTLYYCAKLLFSHLTYIQLEKPYQFIFRLLLFALFMNSSYFICEQIISINSLISSSIQAIGKELFGHTSNFQSLILELNTIISIESTSFNIFSLEGMIKGFISVGLLQLIFSYALRYIMIKVFIVIAPFAILSLIHSSTTWFFKNWLKAFLGLLFLQSFIAIILLIIFSIQFDTANLFSQILYLGGIYALTKANSYIQYLIGGISTEISQISSKFHNTFSK